MEYYIFMWDMVNSTEAVLHDEQLTLAYINKVANFCLESVSELPKVNVIPIGDGQQVLFPKDTDYISIVLPFAESVGRYANSLAAEYPGFRIRSILSKGELTQTPLSLNGAILWRLSAAISLQKPGEFTNRIK